MLGTCLLVEVIFAVFVCAVAVQAAAGPADVRDGPRQQPAVRPRPRPGAGKDQGPRIARDRGRRAAVAFLVVNVNLPNVIETLCSVAIVWANLAYLFVTVPLLLAADCDAQPSPSGVGARRSTGQPILFAGPMGALHQPFRGRLGAICRDQHRLAAPEIYGASLWGRFAAPLATLALVGSGAVYYLCIQRKRRGILAEHRAVEPPQGVSLAAPRAVINAEWIGHGQLAPGAAE